MEGYYIHVANKLHSTRFGTNVKAKTCDVRELNTACFWRAVYAEFLGTLLLTFVGSASVLFDGNKITISMTFGLAIMTLIQMIGHVSGGHVNPAITISFVVAQNISVIRGLLYILAQCCGSIVGAYILKAVTPEMHRGYLGAAYVNTDLGITQFQGAVVEFFLAFTLIMTIHATIDPNKPNMGSHSLAIGLTVGMLHFSGISYTGASMNPAWSLGPAVAINFWKDHWVYWAGPILAGTVASLVYKYTINPYRGVPTMEEAVQTLLQDRSFIVVPRDYVMVEKKNYVKEFTQL
ncbi:aquaporin AQPAe.a-like [Haliotis cracherodii]|uniref:aquaporin AQPAe.a-like n=1 Tax=Haliotis cracherodii TaxID=6455 RepID=UPI0039EB7DD8